MNEVELKEALNKVDHGINISRCGLKKLLDERLYIIEELNRIDTDKVSILEKIAAKKRDEAGINYNRAIHKINSQLDAEVAKLKG